MANELVYQSIPEMSKAEIEEIVEENIPEKVAYAVLSAAMYSGDGPWAEEICYKLAGHPDSIVRGNVFTALGHIARLHERMDWDRATQILRAGSWDVDEFAREHATDGLEDVQHYRNFAKA